MALFNVIKWDAPVNAVAYKFPGDKAAIVIAGLILIGGGIAVGIFVAAWWGRFLISPFLIFAGIMAMKEINNNNNNEGDKQNG